MCHFDCTYYGVCNNETECENCEDYICNPCDICTSNYCETQDDDN